MVEVVEAVDAVPVVPVPFTTVLVFKTVFVVLPEAALLMVLLIDKGR